ncbi:MAG: nucleotidyl transferase AbiEii/AbiGii toxin family protein [bacterium]|nr:nucleotidyl transferase AbiEii/AbiGii toxin family protein [bacterium]
MSNRFVRDVAASVRQRLQNLARQRSEQFQSTMMQYGLERLLYRLSQSEWRATFLLKGAMLFALWRATVWRTTRDLDLLGLGDSSVFEMERVFRGICTLDVVDDGLHFQRDSVHGEEIREQTAYGGVRVTLTAMLGNARLPLQIDIGFGDVVTPKPEFVAYPTLLDFPAPELKVYPFYTVIAEKFEAMAQLGMLNSRMKDVYDLWIMARTLHMQGRILRAAIAATFTRRTTAIPKTAPAVFSDDFARDKALQWQAFLRRNRLDADAATLAAVMAFLKRFLMPVAHAINRNDAFDKVWLKAGPWRQV